MNIAFLFPGQGSQSVGMGKALFEQFELARGVFEEAENVLGWDVADLCFNGPESKLNQTEFTQPALLTTSIAAWRVLGSPIHSATLVAGHSLGEFTALVAAGALSFADAVRLVHLRGQFMQEAVPEGKGAMAAIIGMKREAVEAICAQVSMDSALVSPANYNGPSQIVLSGEINAVKRAMVLAKESGAKLAIQLAVSVPSHSPLMRKACLRLSDELDKISGLDLQKPLVNNLAAEVTETWKVAKSALVDQLSSPLLWHETMTRMKDAGVDQFIEVGPGRVLCGLLKRIDRRAKVMPVEDPEGIEKALSLLNQKVESV
ncbi:MAG: ACP S-malonyltransferase [Nitrospirota bacterium]|nr:ACP S-malonyltransferase [Nitrospirota bacterium]